MRNSINIIAIIPARGGSKGVPRKNIKLVGGKPLIFYSISEAKKSKYISRIIVSTEDVQIAKISKSFGAEVVKRPKNLSRDNSPTVLAIKHVIDFLEKKEKYDVDVVVLLQPTSPFRTSKDIDSCIKKFKKENFDSIVSISEPAESPYWMYSLKKDQLIPLLKINKKHHRRQDLSKIYQLNGAVYVTSRNRIMKKNTILGDKMGGYVMPVERSLDIDNKFEFKIANLLMKSKK